MWDVGKKKRLVSLTGMHKVLLCIAVPNFCVCVVSTGNTYFLILASRYICIETSFIPECASEKAMYF